MFMHKVLFYKIFCSGGRLGGGKFGGWGICVVEGVLWFGELVAGGRSSRVGGEMCCEGRVSRTDACSLYATFFL